MVGWLLADMDSESISVPKNLAEHACRFSNLFIIHMRNGKFHRDNFLSANDRGVICTDGVLLNATELKNAYGFEDLSAFLLESGLDDPVAMIRQFRGPYSGFFHDSQQGQTTIFTNAVGDRPVYIYQKPGIRLAASDLNMLIDFCRANGLPTTFHETAAKMLLEFGFCVDTCTMVREITRLFPGSCLIWEKDGDHEMRYHRLDCSENPSLSEEDAIEGLDQLFRQAVKRSFDKDNEYGYHHLADMSAGMDSRMVNWVAHDLGYKNVTDICYGLPSCTDAVVSARIAADLGYEYCFKSLADASFMLDLDETVRLNFGMALYIGATGTLRFMKALNTDRIGIRHNGNMGDTVFGAYLRGNGHRKPGDLSGHNSSSRSHGPYPVDFSRYESEEEQDLYARYLLADPVSHILVRDHVIAVSPFMDVDFLDYFLHIPIKYRRGNLYANWVKTKYPQAAKYPYNSRVFTIASNRALSHFCTASVRKGLDMLSRALHKCGISKYQYRMTGMNPIAAMYERTPAVQTFFSGYFDSAIGLFDGIPAFQCILKEEFEAGTPTEKTLVLTVMSFAKQHGLQVSGGGK